MGLIYIGPLLARQDFCQANNSQEKASQKICLLNVEPLKSHYYIVKLGFTGVNIIFSDKKKS